MCTAISYKTKDCYFGRTLDLEYSYDEKVVITPRNFELDFRHKNRLCNHYAIIGMATIANGYPLYYEAANEKGLAMAGLNFPQNAHYFPAEDGKDNITSFEFIPWILSQCADIAEAREALLGINLLEENFSDKFPLSPLHWLISDKNSSLVVESVAEGLKVYDSPVGVLTNNPDYSYHMTRLCDFMNITSQPPKNRFGNVELSPYSKGMGAVGLPGDLSSSSRFVRAAFVKLNSLSGNSEEESIGQFFHILGSVQQPRGCTMLPDGRCEITLYTSCINTDKGIYYYTTYSNSCISSVDMRKCDLDAKKLYFFELTKEQIINRQN